MLHRTRGFRVDYLGHAPQEDITEILTHHGHFTQEGFTILL
jgi:hypothetical protein